MLNQDASKKIIDVHYKEAGEQYSRIISSRTEYRDRTITIFTLLLGILGAIIVFQNNEKTFLELWKTSCFILQLLYAVSTFLGLSFFLYTFLYTKSYTLNNVHETLISNSSTLLNSGSQDESIELSREQLTVDDEYYVKVEFIKAYSIATCKIIEDLKIMRLIYILGFISFILSFVFSLFIIFS
jgi:hypothetical protein